MRNQKDQVLFIFSFFVYSLINRRTLIDQLSIKFVYLIVIFTFPHFHFQYFKKHMIIATLKMIFPSVNLNPKRAKGSQFDSSPSELF